MDTLREQGVTVWGEGSRLRYRATKGTLTENLRSQLASQKDTILVDWRERATRETVTQAASHGQRALWFVHQANPGSAAYNVVFSARIRSSIDLPALRRSFQALVDRHASLRTTFRADLNGLNQVVHGYMPVHFELHSRPGIELPALRKEVLEASRAPFDLQNGPLMRVDLFSREVDDYVLVFSVHHIAADGWSLFLLLDDLRQIYPSERGGTAPPPPRPGHDILEHARWQEAMLSSPEGKEHEDYWISKLSGLHSSLNLPTDRPRQASLIEIGASVPVDLGAELSKAVRVLAAAENTTPYVVLLTAYHILLHRYTGQQEVIVGSPTYGRDRPEFGNIVGDFINMIPLLGSFHNDPTFREILAQVRQAVVDGIRHGNYPFPLIVEKLHPNRDFSRTPVFQTVFILQKFKEIAGLEEIVGYGESGVQTEFAGLVLEQFWIPQQEGQFELSIELIEKSGAYGGVLKYNPDLFEDSTVTQLAENYKTLLQAVVVLPDTNASQIPILTRTEREQLVAGLNETDRDYPKERTVVDLIRQQVVRRPNAEAVRYEKVGLTYEELDTISTRLARHLQSLGVGSESLVGVCIERGLEMVVGFLAVLKAGGAYLPLDPAFPAERLRYMLEDSGARVLITRKGLLETLFSNSTLTKVCMDADKDAIEQHDNAPIPTIAKSSDRAYVIYTSGSTGLPKGVEIEHKALTNFLCSMAREPGINEVDIFLAVTTPAFDIAALELFLPLTTGARIHVASRETVTDGVALSHVLEDSGATIMQATPATWRLLFESGWGGNQRLTALCGGETMDREMALRLVGACKSAWNMYGPTETTIWSAIAQIESNEVTIGRPIANTRIYVLDKNLEPVPRGVVGDLWIGGDGVARGYLNRTELTAEKFVSDPFRPGTRMYWTGDLGRHLSDGRLECLGRVDNQVKIRGYRIELGEIEATLSSHPGVRECVVAARKTNTGDVRLTAYVVSASSQRPTIEELRNRLKSVLPEYMIPSGFVFLDSIPLTPNAKVDRNALPAPESNEPDSTGGYVPPRNQVEQIMADAWSEILEIPKVGVFDHFFELGGHSLSATRLVARLESIFKIDLPLRSIFIEPTIAGLSKTIKYDDYADRYYHAGEICRWNRLVPAQPKGSRVPFFLVAGFMDADDTLRVLSRLIPHVGLDQPVYGFQPRWLDGVSDRYRDANEVATEFLVELRGVQAKGPYILGGDCAGGVVALVMAEKLMQQGEEVRLLVLFDTHRPTVLRSLGLDLYNAWNRAKHIIHVLAQIIRSTGSSRSAILEDLRRRKLGAEETKTEEVSATRRLYKLRMDYMRTMYRNRVKTYPGSIALIINEKQHSFDKNMGWRGVPKGGLEVHVTRGDHWTRYLHGEEIAKRLLKCLASVQGENTPLHAK